MRRFIISLLFCVLTIFGLTGSSNSQAPKSLAVTLHPQEMRMWCWAASAQMVMHYLKKNVSQCKQVKDAYGIECCNNPKAIECADCEGFCDDCGGFPDFDKYGFTFKKTDNQALTWNQIVNEISQGRPFCFTWRYEGGGAHMLCAIGYKTVDGRNWVECHDPLPVNKGTYKKWIPYEQYVRGPYNQDHWDDFYEIKQKR